MSAPISLNGRLSGREAFVLLHLASSPKTLTAKTDLIWLLAGKVLADERSLGVARKCPEVEIGLLHFSRPILLSELPEKMERLFFEKSFLAIVNDYAARNGLKLGITFEDVSFRIDAIVKLGEKVSQFSFQKALAEHLLFEPWVNGFDRDVELYLRGYVMEDSGSRYGRENRIWMAQYAEQLLALWSNSLLAYDDEYRMMGRTPPYAAIAGKDADRSHRFLPEEINNRLIDSAAGLFAQEAPALLGAAREKIEKIIVDICGN